MTQLGDFRGAARRLDDVDIPRIGHRIGVGEDEVHAFMEVEAAGSGFDKSGRPKMLFEPHVFYRNLSGAKRDRAVKAGLAYPKWRRGNYPKDSYPRLAQAMIIDEEAALRSASWGATQILGENYRMVGYPSAKAMVLAFMKDEEHHLEAMIQFLISSGIDDDLREHRWEVVARVYNGPRHAEHDYAGRMRRAFAKWQRIADTPWSPEGDAAVMEKSEEPVVREAPEVTEAEFVSLVQRLLRDKGYPEVGRVDGKLGPRTRDAVTVFQRNVGLPLDGRVTGALLEALATAPAREVAKARAEATVEDIRGAEGVKIGGLAKNVGAVVAIGGALGGIFDGTASLEDVAAQASAAQALWATLAGSGPWIILLTVGLGVTWLGRRQIADQLVKFRTGRHV